MRSLRKPLLLLFAVAMVVSVTVYATVAYLTDTEEVTNTFSVGKVDITLDEAKVDPNTGWPGDERTEEANEYLLVPGRTYTKDPTVTVEPGSEPCYVRMVVSVNHKTELQTYFGGFFNFINYSKAGETDEFGSKYWIQTSAYSPVDAPETVVYEFRYYQPVAATPDRLEPLFTSFTIPGELTAEQLTEIADLSIVIQAHAIQIEGFASENEAWTAFGNQVKNPGVFKPATGAGIAPSTQPSTSPGPYA